MLYDGAAAIYHQYGPPEWSGPTGFWLHDYRAPLAADESKTWSSIYLWANPDSYTQDAMSLVIEADEYHVPPADRRYVLELCAIPRGVTGAPPVGSAWRVAPDEPFMVEVPTFATHDGLEGYRFAFTVHAEDLPGDMNCDGVVNAFDIDPFVLALSGAEAFQAAYPLCQFSLADINDDGVVNAFDIDPFVSILVAP